MEGWGSGKGTLERRAVLAALLAGAGALALPGCASMGQGGQVEVVRRLLALSTQRAFARLTQPDGFWNSAVARINLPVLFGKPGSIASKVLKSSVFREKLQHLLNNIAEDGARRAAPVVAEAVRGTAIGDGAALLKGGRTAATTYLRQAMGPALVNAMIPELDQVMRAADDPILGQAIGALSGVNIQDAAHALALEADNAIWYEIGASEAEIRENPASTNDPVLIAGLKLS
ncbi:Protein of unknown function [Novosphingobium sp. CF614]|uniref:DUF4197 domain-containing protein n=1 Tax=Novosphingobium sp. CF614 TaxID=1884364 RepID=UPI0008EC1588|nr:DUF4197 domain-containing protein [Novosphingobium sp. CF614]SFG05891.1 Protein of unknown function [Novosphingobium sp. CF614]